MRSLLLLSCVISWISLSGEWLVHSGFIFQLSLGWWSVGRLSGGVTLGWKVLYPPRWSARSLPLTAIPVVASHKSFRTWFDAGLVYLNGIFTGEVDLHSRHIGIIASDDPIRTMPGVWQFPLSSSLFTWKTNQHSVSNLVLVLISLLMVVLLVLDLRTTDVFESRFSVKGKVQHQFFLIVRNRRWGNLISR